MSWRAFGFLLQSDSVFSEGKGEGEVLPPVPAGAADMESELRFTTIAFGIGNWYLANGDKAKAREYSERIMKGKAWGVCGIGGGVGADGEGKMRL